jgi:hypothetical protein
MILADWSWLLLGQNSNKQFHVLIFNENNVFNKQAQKRQVQSFVLNWGCPKERAIGNLYFITRNLQLKFLFTHPKARVR